MSRRQGRWTARDRRKISPFRPREAPLSLPSDLSDRLRIGRIACRLRYKHWNFTLDDSGALIAFRSDPLMPKRLQMLGPWPLPQDAGDEEVLEVARAAAIAADGEESGDRPELTRPKNRPETPRSSRFEPVLPRRKKTDQD